MLNCTRAMSAAAAALLASACGASNVPPASEADPHEPAPVAPEPAEANESPAADVQEPEAEGDTAGQQGSSGAEANTARDAKAEAEWSPESSQTIVERARRKLQRRCDSGSQAACGAIPNLDKCTNLKRASCASLGDLFAKGGDGVDRNPAHARDFWWRACDIASADCVRYGKLLFDTEDLDGRRSVAERFFHLGCTRDFELCESVGRFYQEKNEPAGAKKFFDIGCSAGQEAACQAKKK
jgi:hypothetical protein